MRIIYVYGKEIWNARKVRLFLRKQGLLILASCWTTVLIARVLRII